MIDSIRTSYSSYEELMNDRDASSNGMPTLTSTIMPSERVRFSRNIPLYANSTVSKELRKSVISAALAHPTTPYKFYYNPDLMEYIFHLIGMTDNLTANSNAVYFIGVVMLFNPSFGVDSPVDRVFMMKMREVMQADDCGKYCSKVTVQAFVKRCRSLLSAMVHGISFTLTSFISVNGTMLMHVQDRLKDYDFPCAAMCDCGVNKCGLGFEKLDMRIEWAERTKRAREELVAAKEKEHQAYLKRAEDISHSPSSPYSNSINQEGLATVEDSDTEFEQPTKKTKGTEEVEV